MDKFTLGLIIGLLLAVYIISNRKQPARRTKPPGRGCELVHSEVVMATEAQKRAKNKYEKKLKRVGVAFYPSDQYLFDYLSTKENKAGFIKELIRQEMIREGIDVEKLAENN